MAFKGKKNDYKPSTKPFRIFTAGKLLLLFLLISLVQYTSTGRVSWVTDSFRWVEATARGVAGDPRGSLNRAEEAIQDMAGQGGGVVSPPESAGAGSRKPKAEISWSQPAFELSGRVSKIADGDTITIIDANRVKHKIRLFGIDSPEYDQPFYREAKQAINRLVNAKSVGVDVKDRDTYGRVVGVVYVNGTNVNLKMVQGGHAWWYRHFAPLNENFREAEDHARAYKVGLWADSKPIAPWEWRRQRR